MKPLGENERAEIIEAANIAMRRNQRGAQGQIVTEWHSIESWIIVETEHRILSALTPAPVSDEADAEDARAALAEFHAKGGKPMEQVETEMSVEEAARENIVDEIEEIIAETHDLDVADRTYAENIVGWLERHHPSALRALSGEGE